MIDFVQISPILVLFKKKNLNQLLNIFGNIESTKKTDQILEIPELGEFCEYCFKNHTCE